jgi:hypothetical protein
MGKVRDAIKVIKTNIVKIKKSLETGDIPDAVDGWKVFNKNLIVYDSLVKNMSGKSKTFGKAEKIEKFNIKVNKFVDDFGKILDSFATWRSKK